MIMKLFLIIFSLFISCISHAQNNLPPCNGNFTGPCFGVIDYPRGKYVVQIKDDKLHQGTAIYADGSKYVGQWNDTKKHGQGTLSYADGTKYVGQFIDGKFNGFGTFYDAKGSIMLQGLWRNDKFVQAQNPPPVSPPEIPKSLVNNAQDIKRQRCINLGLAPNSVDFQQCIK